ncbi:MAG: hypothetical protein QXU47_00130 [Candidatus Bathyarchaeia archaeon]
MQQGAWVSYDGISEATAERTLKLVGFVFEHGFEGQLLLSQDAGWYNVGEPKGGSIRRYSYLIKDLISLMMENEFNRDFIEKILVGNPSRAFQIR